MVATLEQNTTPNEGRLWRYSDMATRVASITDLRPTVRESAHGQLDEASEDVLIVIQKGSSKIPVSLIPSRAGPISRS